jgi:membrane dipeptidase
VTVPADAQAPAARDGGRPALTERARRVYRDAIVIDTHNDMPSRMADLGYDPDVRHPAGEGESKAVGHTDLPRLIESGITAEFMSAWPDAKYAFTSPESSYVRARQLIDSVHAFARRHPDRLLLATTAADVRRAKAEGKVALLIGVEGGHAIQNDLAKLDTLAALGVRYLTLTWNNGLDWAGAAAGQVDPRTGQRTPSGGLSDFGRQVVRRMNELGLLVDISHVSKATFWDAIAESKLPVIASHSSAQALNPHVRNMDDEQLRAVARNGGVVNVNFYAAFIRTSGKAGDPVPFSVLIDHIDHIAKVAGVDHVGLGSDFDGVSQLPEGVRDVTDLVYIAQGLLDRGYSDADVTKMLGGNMLRVMEQAIDRREATLRGRGGEGR